MGIIRLIMLGLLILVLAIPGFGLGYLLTKISPGMGLQAHLLWVLGILGGLAILGMRSKGRPPKAAVPLPDAQPAPAGETTKRPSIKSALLFLVATAFGGLLSYGNNKTTLYIDNGTAHWMNVSYRKTGLTIAPGSYQKMEVVEGPCKLIVNGGFRTLDLSKPARQWVWNVEQQNIYYLDELVFSSSSALRDSTRSWWSSDTSSMNNALITDEVFSTEADYVFDAPETIQVSKRFVGNKDVARLLLYRITKQELADIRARADTADYSDAN